MYAIKEANMKENIYDCMDNSGMGPNHLMKKKI